MRLLLAGQGDLPDTNAEVAQRLGCVVETVERRLRLIRSVWQNESGA